MELCGRVHNGIVVLDGGVVLPEGAVVIVTYPARAETSPPPQKKRIEFPLVPSANPGGLDLTNERIAAILDEEDASPRC
jgi:hypothetical protein